MGKRLALLGLTCALAVGAASAHAQGVQTAEGWIATSPFGPGARVALNDAGEAVVAWRIGERVLATTGDARGFGAPTVFAAPGAERAAPQVAIDDAGNEIVVWETTLQHPMTCPKCGGLYASQSTGVWVARRPAGASFGTAQRLAGELPSLGDVDNIAQPQLAAPRNGRASLAWADALGSVVVEWRDGELGTPRRLSGPDFTASSLAVGGHGDLIAGNRDGQVVTCPSSGPCAAPRYLRATGTPGSHVFDVHVAANDSGAMLATYPEFPGVAAAQRPAGGEWTPSAIVSPGGDVAVRAAALADDGEATVAWIGNVDPRIDGRRHLFEAHGSDAAAMATSEVSPAIWDATAGPRLSMTPDGDVAFAMTSYAPGDSPLRQTFAQVAVRRHGAAHAGAPATLTPTDAVQAPGDSPDVAFNARGELLAVWTDVRGRTAQVNAQGLATDGPHPPLTLATAAVTVSPVRPPPRGHVTMINPDSPIKPSPRGFVVLPLSCLSFDRRGCYGTVTLRYKGTRVGRTRFTTIPPGFRRRVSVQLSRRLRSRLAGLPRGLTVLATVVTEDANGASPDRGSVRVPLKRR